jgi:F0F1-type ATP synthase delta subunit
LTGAKDVKLIIRVIPDLSGGMRLRWGSTVFDGSIKWRLEKMAGDIGLVREYGGITKNDAI